MTFVLILLCLAIAGRELYLAFDRNRVSGQHEAVLGELRRQVNELAAGCERVREELHGTVQVSDTRVRSLISQINDRVVPDVNAQLAGHRAATDRLRGVLRARLDAAVAASLGADPADTVLGVLGGAVPDTERTALADAYEKFAMTFGLHVELADPDGDTPWQLRYYLTGPSPRELERDFIDLVRDLRRGDAGPAEPLLTGLHQVTEGVALLGPLTIVRTPDALHCGVRPLADLLRPDPSALADVEATAGRLSGLPPTRWCSWEPPAQTA
jgi:hypothetical protein